MAGHLTPGARAGLDQHGAGWERRLDEMVEAARRELLPIDADGLGGAIADLAKHMYETAQPEQEPQRAMVLATYAATAILRLARQAADS